MKEEKRKSPAVYVFLAFMAALLIANICIRVAIPRVNLYEEGKNSLEAYPRAVYTLPEGTYEVLGSFGSEAGSASHIPFKTWERRYYCILVSDSAGQQYVMAARVQGRELQALEAGTAVELKGLVSGLSEERAKAMHDAALNASAEMVDRCINDNGRGSM